MGLGGTLILGLIAGATILLGLPVGRLRHPAAGLRVMLNAVAVGVLLFLVWDILSHAWEPIDQGLGNVASEGFGAGLILDCVLFVGGLAVGLLALVWYESWLIHDASGSRGGLGGWSAPRRLSLLIAVGIGFHNFAEGLAIGQSAARGEIGLATVLVVGFALHNGTEGFGITAPLAGDVDAAGVRRRPSWRFLLLLGLIGGGPTFLGAWVGHGFTSEPVSIVFLSLAAGSIIYVITQLTVVAARAHRASLVACGLLIGLVAGFATDGILVAAGS